MSTRLARLVAAVSAAITVAACGQSEPAAQSPSSLAGGSVAVVASTDVWASVAKVVGGNEVDVKAIIADPAGDPHSYQVTVKDAATLRDAALVVYNGGGYDEFVERSLGTGGPKRVNAFDLHKKASGQPPSTTRGFAHPAAAAGVAGAHEEGENEHVWYELPTVALVASEIANQLGQLKPSAKATFDAHAKAFNGNLDTLTARTGEIAAAHQGKQVLMTEPVAHYLLAAAKLTDVTPEEFVEAIEEETDPPAAAVAEIQQVVTQRRIAVLVHNPQTETPVVADLLTKARAAGLPVVDMTETLPTGLDYVTWMGNQIQALSAALAGR
jgi:zinc/manganese transport system substrate-binding protein